MSAHQSTLSGFVLSGSGGGGSTSNLSNCEEEESKKITRPRKRKDRPPECDHKKELMEFRDEIMKFFDKFATKQNECLLHIRQEITDMANEIKSLTKTTEILTSKYDTLQKEIQNIKSENKTIQDRLKQAACLSISDKSPSLTHEDLMTELRDRCDREKNIVIVGIKEICDKNFAARRLHDEREIRNVLAPVLEQINCELPKSLKTMRLGKYNPARNRPLKVFFECTTIPRQLLRNRSKLPTNIRLYADQTPSQKKYMQQLAEELQKRKDSGEMDLIIKYIKGVPKIIKSKND